jgi:PAS domain S-box-containing protein
MNPISIIRVFGKSTLGRRFTVIALMFLSVLLGIMIYTTATIQKEKSNALLIDIAGRQRMLFQKHMNEVFLSSQGITTDYNSTRKLLRSTLDSLMKGGLVVIVSETGQRQPVPAVPTEEIFIKLREQRNHFDKIIELADSFLLRSPDDPEFQPMLLTLRAQNSTLIGIADEAVKLLNRHSESNITMMMKWETITAFFVALLGVFVTSQGIRASKKLENEVVERKRTESALQDSELFLNSIIENIPHMIFVKDAKDLQFLRFNKAGEELVGHPKKAMIGKTDYDFFPKSEADFYTTKDREVLAAKTLLDIPEEVIHTKSQGTRYLHTKKIPILDAHDTPLYLLGISEDITEQKQAALKRDERELLLSLIFETRPECIKRVATDGTLLHMNPAGLALIEAEEENEALGLSVFDLVVPEHVGAFKHMHQNVLQGKPQTLQFEVQGFKGTRRWMETYAVPFNNPITKEVEQLAVTNDITERKTSEERAKQLSHQNELILSSAGGGIYGLNLQGQTTFVNPAGAKLLGYTPQELIGRSMHTVVHHTKSDGSPYPQEECPMYAAFTDGTIHKVEDEVLWRKDGTSFPVDYSSMPIWQDGNLAGAVVTFQDVTERKEAEKKFKDSEQKFRVMAETVPDILFTNQPDGSCDFVNQRLYEYTRLPSDSGLGFGWAKALHPDDLERSKDKWLRTVHEALPYEDRYRLLSPDGTYRWFLARAIPIKNAKGRLEKYFGVSTDIHDLVQTEEALRQSEERLSYALEATREGVWDWNIKTDMVLYSKRWCDNLGLAPEEVEPHLNSWKALVHPEDLPMVMEKLEAHLEGQTPVFSHEYRLLTKPGTWRWTLDVGKVVTKDQDGKPLRMVGTNADITEQKEHQLLLETLHQAQSQFIIANDPSEMFDHILHNLLTLTQSQYGFIGEILSTTEGQPYLKTHAITNIAWNQETRELYERFAPNLEFFNLNTLFGKVITTGQPVLANDPINDPRGGGLPKGHPPMHAFLGLPFYSGDRLVGMVGIANRPKGYDAQLIAYLQPLLSSCGILIEGHKNSEQRVHAETTLRATEQMYRQILDSISDMVFMKDQNFRMLWANKAFRTYYNMTNEELSGILDAPFNAPEFTQQYNEADAHVLNTGEVFDIPEEPVTQHDGQVHLFHTIKAPLFAEDGEVVKLVGVSRDITERKNSEKALEALAKGAAILGNQNFFQNLVRQLAHTLQVQMVFISERVEETFPIVPGVAFWHRDHFEEKFDYDCGGGPCEKVFDGHPVYISQKVQELFPKNSTVKALNLESYCGTPLFNSKGAVIGNLAIMDQKPLSLNAQDHSLLQVFADRAGAELERKRAQEALQESEERYRVLYEDNPSMYFTVAQNGTILSVNQFGAQQLGYSVQELVGQPVIGVFLENDKPLAQQHFNSCLQDSDTLTHWELRKQRKDGSVLWVREAARTIQGEDGKSVVLIVCEDITERKHTEERLRQSEAKRTEALRQSDELKSALLSSVSHELRTPLTAMKGSVSSIIGNSQGSKEQEQENVLKGIDREINYMSHLVDNLLDMSQIEAGTLTPHKEWHLLEDLVEGALRRTAQTSDTRNIEIHIPENVPPVFVDALEIQQVLINLLDNAVKYSSPSSPIRIHVRVEAQQITVEASNMGEPIQPQHLERIFDRFYRRPPTRKQPIRGTGLGLAICKGIVEAHGGRIWADSIGKAVTITFTIPITESMPSFSLEGRHKS